MKRAFSAWMIFNLIAMPLLPQIAHAASCDQICNDIDTAISTDQQKKCLPNFAPGSSSMAGCKKAVADTYAQTNSYCAAYKANEKGSEGEVISAALYTTAATIAAITCGLEITCAACSAACTPVCGAAATMEQVTMYASIAAGVGDMINAMIQKQYMSGIMSGLVGGGGGALAAGMANTFAVDAAIDGGVDAGSTNYGGCASMAILGIIAGLKWANQGGDDNRKQEACGQIQKLVADFKYTDSNANNPTANGSPPPGSIAGGYNGVYTGGSGTTGNTPGTSGATGSTSSVGSGTPYSNLVKKPDGLTSIAASASNDPVLRRNPNTGQFFNALEKNGVDPKDLLSKLDSMSPSSAINSSANLPSNVAAALSQIDRDIKSGVLTPSMLGDLAKSSGGGGGGGGKSGGQSGSDPFAGLFNLNKKDGGGEAGKAGLGFNTNSKTGLPGTQDDNDIWHTGTKLSIFQIVSQRYGKTGGKVEKLEYASPMNRAMLGLPQQQKSPTGRGK